MNVFYRHVVVWMHKARCLLKIIWLTSMQCMVLNIAHSLYTAHTKSTPNFLRNFYTLSSIFCFFFCLSHSITKLDNYFFSLSVCTFPCNSPTWILNGLPCLTTLQLITLQEILTSGSLLPTWTIDACQRYSTIISIFSYSAQCSEIYFLIFHKGDSWIFHSAKGQGARRVKATSVCISIMSRVQSNVYSVFITVKLCKYLLFIKKVDKPK